MKNNSVKAKVITGVVLAGMLLSVGASVFAKDASNAGKTRSTVANHQGNKKGGDFTTGIKTTLNALTKAGTITQDQEDKIVAYVKEKADANKATIDKVKAMTAAERKAYFEANKGIAKVDLFADLVAQNIITQAQADSIKAALPQKNNKDNDKFKGEKFSFNNFVKSGIITQDKADKITAYLKTKADANKAERDKVKAMTAAERKAYFEANKGTAKVDLFADLVAQNIITQAEADSIKATFPQRNTKGKSNFKAGNFGFDNFVKSGIITQDKADKITAYLKTKADANKAERDKVKAMTEAERKAYFEANKGTAKVDLFADLVAQNIITQAEADSIKATFPKVNNKNKTKTTHTGKKAHNTTSTQSAIQTGI